MQWEYESLILTDEVREGFIDSTYALLQTTYWSHVRPRRVVEQTFKRSLCFFLLESENQIGFGRVISDLTTTSWIADVVLDERYRGRGIGTWMMQCIMAHPDVCDTQFVLQTGSAHEFYERLGFQQKHSLMSTSVDYLDLPPPPNPS